MGLVRFIACVWTFRLYAPCVYREQRKVSDLLLLELQIVMSSQVGVGNWAEASKRAASALDC